MQVKIKKFAFLVFMVLVTFNIYGQINISDSTVQVIGYWDINETQSYTITNEKYRIQDSDTVSREFAKYEVDITIIDSTANSYTIEWYYRDYVIDTDNEFVRKMTSLVEDMRVIIKTDELGAFVEIVNWKDFKKLVKKTNKMLNEEFKDIPQMDKIIKQVKAMYSTKEAIESAAIKEIHQFYSYHGGKYELDKEIIANLKSPNLLGGEPFDTELKLWLDEINYDDNNSIIRMVQEVNSDQLTNATFEYLMEMAVTLGNTPPERINFPQLINETWLASRIHGSGWVIYSIETKEVSAEGALNVEERIIEIQ